MRKGQLGAPTSAGAQPDESLPDWEWRPQARRLLPKALVAWLEIITPDSATSLATGQVSDYNCGHVIARSSKYSNAGRRPAMDRLCVTPFLE